MSFPLASAQLQENPRAGSSFCRSQAGLCAAFRAVHFALGLQFLPRYRSQKLEISATADTCLTLPFHRFPNSRRKNRTARSLFVQGLGTCSWHACFLRRRCHLLANGSPGSGRRPTPAARCLSSSGWDRALGGRRCHTARLVGAAWGENAFLNLLHVWWALAGQRSRRKREGPRCRVFLKALPYF